MVNLRKVLSKIVYVLLFVLCFITFISCNNDKNTVEITITPSATTIKEGEVVNLDVQIIGTDDKSVTWNISHPEILSVDINFNAMLKTTVTEDTVITITVTSNADSSKSATTEITAKVSETKPTPNPPAADVTIAIEGPSEIKSGKSIDLTAVVNGSDNKTVTWTVIKGAEYVSIDSNGKLTAKETSSDHNVQVKVISSADPTVNAVKNITVVGKPVLTQDMLDEVSHDKIAFDGYIQIDLYTTGIFEKFYQTYTTPVKTAMNGTNWFAEYQNGDTGTTMQLYYGKNNNLACQVGVSFMNEEEYFPMLDEFGNEVSWNDAGLYNSFKTLKVSDFTFNEETWRYEYTGKDQELVNHMLASANPYDFVSSSFSLIIEEGFILGIHSKANADYSIVAGYKAMQQLFVTLNCGETVEVPLISKYSHEDIHDDLAVAIENMQKLDSYTLDFMENTATLGYVAVETGFTEQITADNCFFRPYTVSYDLQGELVKTYDDKSNYGFKKISDELYNAYYQYDTEYKATRAYESDFANAKPTFKFAAEIFREYYIDEEDGSITYYVDPVMSTVASTFYYGLGNDINLYGIFATSTEYLTGQTFKPYIVVKDDYIVESGFYYFVGSIYGIVQINYSDFNKTNISSDTNIEFETRQIPNSWSQLEFYVSTDEGSSTTDDVPVNALEYLKTFYGDENIEQNLPFFGNVIGDTFGFGLTTMHLPSGGNMLLPAVMLYYDVPLDLDYTIDSSIETVNEYLRENGFVQNKNGWFQKGDVCVAPTDSSLDFVIYIWKAN